jgi:LacI family transcriptional regulator
VFCANDLVAVGVLRGLLAAGVRVPEDVAIVGFDDIEVAAVAHVPLTSVRLPMNELGRAAMELLLTEIDDGDAHEHRSVVFEPELAVRASTDLSAG